MGLTALRRWKHDQLLTALQHGHRQQNKQRKSRQKISQDMMPAKQSRADLTDVKMRTVSLLIAAMQRANGISFPKATLK